MKRINFIILTLALMLVGFTCGYVIRGYIKPSTMDFTKETFNHFETDSIQSIKEDAESVLEIREKGKYDSIKMVAAVRDSLILLKGKIGIAQLAFDPKSILYKQLDSLYLSVTEMGLLLDYVIMNEILDRLRSTNQQFVELIKNITESKEKLEKIAGRFQAVANMVQTLINILSSPIFPSPTVGTAGT